MPSHVLLHLNTIWQLFSHKGEEEGWGGEWGGGVAWRAVSLLLHTSTQEEEKKIKTCHKHTLERRGNRDVAPVTGVLLHQVRFLCVKHQIKVTRRGREKKKGGWVVVGRGVRGGCRVEANVTA